MSDVKAVVVRLPLSGEQREKFLFCIDSGEPIDAETSALEAALLAVGTPVAGGELEYCAQIVWYDDAVEPEVAAWRNKDIKKGANIKVVRQSDALAKLAEKDAEIARLREYYEASEVLNSVGLFNATPEMFERKKRARKALKGQAA